MPAKTKKMVTGKETNVRAREYYKPGKSVAKPREGGRPLKVPLDTEISIAKTMPFIIGRRCAWRASIHPANTGAK